MAWVIIIVLVVLAITLLTSSMDSEKEISSTKFWNYAKDGKIVGKVYIKTSAIVGTMTDLPEEGIKPGETRKFRVAIIPSAQEDLDVKLREVLAPVPGTEVIHEPDKWFEGGFVGQLFFLFLLGFVLWFFVFRRLGQAAGGGGFLGNFGRSRHKLVSKEHTRITFADVAGVEEAKDEVSEVVEFLRNPKKFQRLGGRIPRGVLLVGLPGCGKTLLAKAIAGEAEVPFFAISGSDFVEMFVGVGASRVRDLFKQAKESSPCIIFLDEIDAVGRRRGTGFGGGGHDEREQTLNAILVEMDGFESSDQVIVIAATNRMDVLDPALTRPGRFDRQIDVPLPDLRGRYEILRIYAAKVECSPDVDLQRLARGTPMFSGADLAALVNEAAIAATMSAKEFVEQDDLEEARDKVRWGRARRSRLVDEKEKNITAYHEAGHALVQMLLPDADPLHKVTILARGGMGGATFALPEKDRNLFTRSYCRAQLCVCLGGRLAEELFCDDISSGASGDIAQASQLARMMVLDWGMSEKLGFVRYSADPQKQTFGIESKDYSDRTAELIDQEIRDIIDTADSQTRKILEENRPTLENIAQAVLKYETLTADDVQRIIDGEILDKPTVADLLSREQERKDAQQEEVEVTPAPEVQTPPDTPPLPEPG